MAEPTFDQFVAVMREVFEKPELQVTRETVSAEVPGWDSLSHVRLIFGFEDAFGCEIEVSDTLELANVGALYDYVVAHAG